jgi:hypothetical protein
VFAYTGTFVAQYRLPLRPSDGPAPYLLACAPNGTFAFLAQPADLPLPKEKLESTRTTSPLRLADSRGNVVRRVGAVMTNEYSLASNGMVVPRPLGRATLMALSARYLFVGTADSASVDVYTLEGSRVRAIATGATPRHPTKAELERSAAELVSFDPNARSRAAMQQLLLDIPAPLTLPPYSALLTDPGGALWVVLSAPGDPHTVLEVFSPEGQHLADVTVPVNLTVREVGADYILGTYEDARGEPHVALYRMRRR